MSSQPLPPSPSSSTDSPTTNDVQFLSNGYDELLKFQKKANDQLQRIESRLLDIESRVQKLSEAIDEALIYSYQYNLKLIGVPQVDKKESADQTTDLCLKIFKAIGANVNINDIDIAHRVPSRRTNTNIMATRANPARIDNPIVCKFTRRLAKNDVLSKKKNLKDITPSSLSVSIPVPGLRILIFRHLAPRIQILFNMTKEYKANHHYKYCWAKDSCVFLRKDDDSTIIKIECEDDLEALQYNS